MAETVRESRKSTPRPQGAGPGINGTVEWLTRAQASERLRVGIRRVLEYANDGHLRTRLERDPQSGQMAYLIHAGDVERFQTKRESAPVVTAVLRPKYSVPSAPPAAQASPHPAAWLTLEEAAAHSRLPASYLLELVVTKELPARDVGVRPGGKWRIKQEALDALPSGDSETSVTGHDSGAHR